MHHLTILVSLPLLLSSSVTICHTPLDRPGNGHSVPVQHDEWLDGRHVAGSGQHWDGPLASAKSQHELDRLLLRLHRRLRVEPYLLSVFVFFTFK